MINRSHTNGKQNNDKSCENIPRTEPSCNNKQEVSIFLWVGN